MMLMMIWCSTDIAGKLTEDQLGILVRGKTNMVISFQQILIFITMFYTTENQFEKTMKSDHWKMRLSMS